MPRQASLRLRLRKAHSQALTVEKWGRYVEEIRRCRRW